MMRVCRIRSKVKQTASKFDITSTENRYELSLSTAEMTATFRFDASDLQTLKDEIDQAIKDTRK